MGHSVGEDPHRFQAQQRKEGVTEYKSFYHFLVNARLPSLRTNRKDMRTERRRGVSCSFSFVGTVLFLIRKDNGWHLSAYSHHYPS